MNKPVKQTGNQAASEALADHDAWVHEQVGIALKAKREGRSSYKTLDEIAAKFSRNAD